MRTDQGTIQTATPNSQLPMPSTSTPPSTTRVPVRKSFQRKQHDKREREGGRRLTICISTMTRAVRPASTGPRRHSLHPNINSDFRMSPFPVRSSELAIRFSSSCTTTMDKAFDACYLCKCFCNAVYVHELCQDISYCLGFE